MAISLTQSAPTNTVASGTTSLPVTFGSSVATGATVIAAVLHITNGVHSVSDGAGNTYTLIGSIATGASQALYLYRASNVIGGALVVTFSLGNNFSTAKGGAWEFAGLDSAGTLDGTALTNSGTGGAEAKTASWTTTNANDLLLVGLAGSTYAGTPPTGYTSLMNQTSSCPGDLSYQIVSATQSGATPTWTGTFGSWATLAAAIKAGATGGPFPWFLDDALAGGLHTAGLGW